MIQDNSLEINNDEGLYIDQFVESIYNAFDIELMELKSNMNQNDLGKLLFYLTRIVKKIPANKNLNIWDYGTYESHKKLVA